jgi:signal transduction histidine kinase
MITFVTIAASIETPRSFLFDVLGTAEEPEAVQSFFEGRPDDSTGALLAVVPASSDQHDTWADCIETHTSRAVNQVENPVSLASGHVYVVPPGVVLRLGEGGLMLERSETVTEQIPLEPMLQALIDDQVTPVRLVLSQNGREEKGREERVGGAAIPPSVDTSLPLSGIGAEPSAFGRTSDDNIDERLQDMKTILRKRTRQVRRLSRALIHAKEDERKRIRQILHDDLQQLLFAARMNVQNLQERASLNASHETLASRAEEQLTDGLDVTRGLCAQLTPPDEEQSLVSQFEWLAIRMQETYGLQVTVHSQGLPQISDRDCMVLLYRLVQELLFNIVKHAEVEEATLQLRDQGDAVRIDVEDEGKGFEPNENTRSEGNVGLDTVIDRVESIGGTVSVESAPGEGTRVTIVFPDLEDGATDESA